MDKIQNGILIYASRYGSTEEYARKIADALGYGIITARDAGEAIQEHLFERPGTTPVILGSPIYGLSVLWEMEDFIERNSARLTKRVIGAFVVCGDDMWIPEADESGSQNLEKLISLLPEAPAVTAVFSGRMRMEDLNDEDRTRILAFYKKIGKEPLGFDRMDLSAVGPFVELIKEHLGGGE